MKKLLLGIIFLSIFIVSSKAEAVLINYDGTGFGINNYEEILNYYSALPGSPVYSSGFQWLDYGGFIDTVYGPHSTTAMAFSLETNSVSIAWDQDVHNVNFWYGYNRLVTPGLSVQGYNDGNLVFDSSTLALNSNGMFQYAAPDVAIDKLQFNGSPDYWTIDDLSYELNSGGTSGPVIPEPATLILVGSGLLGLTVRKKVS